MSSAILASQQREQLAGVVSPSVLKDLDPAKLSDFQLDAIRKTYNDSFTETMKICAIVAGIGVILTMGTYSRSRLPIQQQRDQHARQEVARREVELAEKHMAGSDSSGQST